MMTMRHRSMNFHAALARTRRGKSHQFAITPTGRVTNEGGTLLSVRVGTARSAFTEKPPRVLHRVLAGHHRWIKTLGSPTQSYFLNSSFLRQLRAALFILLYFKTSRIKSRW